MSCERRTQSQVLVWLILHVDLLTVSFLGCERERGLRGVEENARFDKNEGTELDFDFELDPTFVTTCARGRVGFRIVRASTAGLSSRVVLCIVILVIVV
jgi:hypothetical protein